MDKVPVLAKPAQITCLFRLGSVGADAALPMLFRLTLRTEDKG